MLSEYRYGKVRHSVDYDDLRTKKLNTRLFEIG